MIGKILVAVDGSENSVRALDFALDVAEKYSSAVAIINVRESPVMGAVPIEPASVLGESIVVVGAAFKHGIRRYRVATREHFQWTGRNSQKQQSQCRGTCQPTKARHRQSPHAD